jgi:uncharacterized protein YoxC
VVAVCFLIPVLLQIRRTAQEVEKTLETARTQIVPISHSVTALSQDVHGILQSLHRQVDKLEGSFTTVRESADRLREFEEDFLRRLQGPLWELTTLVSAVSKGVGTFVRMLLR